MCASGTLNFWVGKCEASKYTSNERNCKDYYGLKAMNNFQSFWFLTKMNEQEKKQQQQKKYSTNTHIDPDKHEG